MFPAMAQLRGLRPKPVRQSSPRWRCGGITTGCDLAQPAVRPVCRWNTFGVPGVAVAARVQPSLHWTTDASRLAALLLPRIFPIFLVVAVCDPGPRPSRCHAGVPPPAASAVDRVPL